MTTISYRPWLNIESLQGSDLKLYRCVDEASEVWQVPPHCHEHYEVVFYHSIDTRAVLDGKSITLTRGDLIILPPYTLHQFEVDAGKHAYTCFHLEPKKVAEILKDENLLNAPIWKKIPESELNEIWSVVELHHQALDDQPLKKYLELSLFYWIFERALKFEDVESWEASPFQKLLIYLDQHRLFHFKAEDAANFLGYSRPHFMNRFKKQFKLNYNEFLTQRQIHWARQLLSSTKLSIESISQELGFKNPSYFIRVFKKITDTTPVQYRKKLLK
jgi:AraC-like DNA-binding protein/mannose-6-phosphate isomerase-like protein (cupin superfamily)